MMNKTGRELGNLHARNSLLGVVDQGGVYIGRMVGVIVWHGVVGEA